MHGFRNMTFHSPRPPPATATTRAQPNNSRENIIPQHGTILWQDYPTALIVVRLRQFTLITKQAVMCSHRNSHLPSVWICLPSLQSFCQNTIHELIKCLVHGWGIPYGMVSVQRIHITVNTMAVDSCPCDSCTPAHVTLVLLCSASPRSRWTNRMMHWPSFFLNILFWHQLNGKHFRGPLRCCIWSDSCELLCMA